MKSSWVRLLISGILLFGVLWLFTEAPVSWLKVIPPILIWGALACFAWLALNALFRRLGYTFLIYQFKWVNPKNVAEGATCDVHFYFNGSHCWLKDVPERVQEASKKEVEDSVLKTIEGYNVEVETAILEASSQTNVMTPVQAKVFLQRVPKVTN